MAKDIMNLFNAPKTEAKELKVTTLEEATAIAKEIARVSEQIDAVAQAYDTELKAVEVTMKAVRDRYDAMLSPLQDELRGYNKQLTEYHESTLEAATDAEKEQLKSIKLPYNVTLASRSKPAALAVSNDEAYLAKARELGLVKEEAKWGEMKKLLTVTEDNKVIIKSTGEVADFIEVQEQGRVFDVKWN